MNMITLSIDGVKVSVPAGTTVLEAARAAGIRIPTLCYLKGINEIGACRMCLVDTGARAWQAACVLPVEAIAPNRVTGEITVKTNTPALREARKTNLELLLSNHNKKCLSCVRSTNCELQALCREYGVDDENRYAGSTTTHPEEYGSVSIVRDNSKCVLCRRCVAVCSKVQKVGVIGAVKRGFNTSIASAWDMSLGETACINCGQCIAVCPVGALTERDNTAQVFAALADPTKHVVVQPAPAVRAALGEEFGMPMGTRCTGKMAAALRRLGFDKVFDTDFGADLTIMEEATELVGRIKNKGVLPMITSCSPGWIKFCETYYPEFLPNLSSCKSPHEMEGAMIKSYYAEKAGVDPRDIVVVSVMPCTAKKFEAARPELGHDGLKDVDIVITTRELARMIKNAGINFTRLPDEDFDSLLGESTGAGVIFGATGGVAEAVVRRVMESESRNTLQAIAYSGVRGMEGVRAVELPVGEKAIRVGVVHGLKNARTLIAKMEAGEEHFDLVEVMTCTTGCVGGAGQPIGRREQKYARAEGLYEADRKTLIKSSQHNPILKALYEKITPERAHELLHVHYPQPE